MVEVNGMESMLEQLVISECAWALEGLIGVAVLLYLENGWIGVVCGCKWSVVCKRVECRFSGLIS
jgi:hypothetical protein